MSRIISAIIGLSSVLILIYILFLSENEFIISSVLPLTDCQTVIIDAGHGGEDGGTSSSDGTLEKDINLKIALKLRSFLELAGYNTIMTREEDIQLGDTSLSTIRKRKVSDIKTRLKITEDNPQAILISIHQNHFSSSVYKGLQVFYSPKNIKSKFLAESIQSKTVELIQKDNDRFIKETGSNIYLLYNSQIPSVMVECGFMSNYEESNLLKNENYQKQIAFSIMCGIQKYLEDNDG